MSSPLPSPRLVSSQSSLDELVRILAGHDRIAVDTESNSLHAYRERVCLIQFSIPDADFIVDPIAVPDLSPLAAVFANPQQEKILHAAENDLFSLGRDFGFVFANIFDTMTAARTMGWPQVGLAAILDTHFGVTLNKKYQRADWGRRPLTAEMLDYARFDTHFLPALRDRQFRALTDSGNWEEAEEEFARLARVRVEPGQEAPDPLAFWRVKGAFDLPAQQAAVLQALFAWREAQAERIDQPPFKVLGEPALLALARHAPLRVEELQRVAGLASSQVQRYGRDLVRAIERGLRAPAPPKPQAEREPDDVRERYDRLHTWRKERARARGVESDVILPRAVLRDMARRPPLTAGDLATITDFGPWRRATYGAEVLALLSATPAVVATRDEDR
jgi:ribonuclease D